MLEFNGFSVLFLADIFWLEVNPILENIKGLDKIDLIKIPHHGAKENNEGIVEWSNKKCCKKMIITGKKNWDKEHPNEEFIERLNELYDTDIDIYTEVDLQINGRVIYGQEIDMMGGN